MNSFSNPLTEYTPQLEFGSEPAATLEGETGSDLFDELQELELASNLLDVVTEEQLDRFLDEAIRRAGNAAGVRVEPHDMHAIRDVLKSVVHQVLPVAHAQHATHLHDAVGARLASGLSSLAGPILGLELEGLSPEDREFEAVKQFARFAGQTVRNVIEASSSSDPRSRARHAAADAAQVYAPGLFSGRPMTPGDSGRWVAGNNRITLFGV